MIARGSFLKILFTPLLLGLEWKVPDNYDTPKNKKPIAQPIREKQD
jgi:hypothetical protein